MTSAYEQALAKVASGTPSEVAALDLVAHMTLDEKVQTDSCLETAIQGLFVAGDGPGVAGNIVSASATGLIPAKAILKRR